MAPGPAEPCMAMARQQKDDKQHAGSYAAMFSTACFSVKFRAVIGLGSPSLSSPAAAVSGPEVSTSSEKHHRPGLLCGSWASSGHRHASGME